MGGACKTSEYERRAGNLVVRRAVFIFLGGDLSANEGDEEQAGKKEERDDRPLPSHDKKGKTR